MTFSLKFLCLRAESSSFGDSNDCSVIAYAATTGTDYATSHYILEEYGKRPRNGGPHWRDYLECFKAMGYSARLVPFKAKTMVTLEREFQHRTGNYLVSMSNGCHAAAIVDGEVVDWSQGRRRRIDCVWRITESDRPEFNLLRHWIISFQQHRHEV